MSCLVDSSFVRYAAIKTGCSQDSPEPLVIAYSNERSLRELIASPSILGLGFDSRAAAVRKVRDDFSIVVVSRRMSKRAGTTATDHKCQFEGHSARRGLGGRLRFRKNLARRVLQRVVLVAALVFYSENIVSAMIRATLGSPY